MENTYLRSLFMKVRITGILIIFFMLGGGFMNEMTAQQNDSIPVIGIIKNGDTIIYRNIPEIVVIPEINFENARQERRYNRFVTRVKKVYPYARLAGELLREIEPVYMTLEDDKERRRMMKDLEQELLDEYKDDLKRMTISEGRILIKLIDRETTRTSYSLIKDFRGGVPAFFWQGIARIFGADLKAGYDPYGEDRMLEYVVGLIESGYL
jgi:hypothetical protein